VVAALMVAAAVLQSQALVLFPARGSLLGSEAVAGFGHSDSHAVLPHRSGQTSDCRTRWEPTPGVAWLGQPDRVVPLRGLLPHLAPRPTAPVPAPRRSRICRWLI
jgi:hypothetical protein